MVREAGGALVRYAIVDGMNVRDSRLHNYPPRWNAAPSQDLLHPADVPGRLSSATLHCPGRWLLRVEGDQGPES
jgi:hypothetical protein